MTEVDSLGLATAAVSAARSFAFPLGLTLAVSAFLILQSKIDHKDPKLAMASWRREVDYFD
jgi:hypothetical protein